MTGTKEASRRRRRLIVFTIYVGFLALLFLIGAEVVARLRGFKPYRLAEVQTRVEPGGKLFQAHPVLGYVQVPGQFKITLADGYSFKVTHNTNTLRATHAPWTNEAVRPALWVMGCSFTHGWSLNDEETYPWRLQAALPNAEVFNFGVNGYGTAQSLVQYREFLKTEHKPAVVVAAYAYFHNQRSAFARLWRKSILPYNKLGPIAPPYARLDPAGQVVIHNEPLGYGEWPLQRYSALVHMAEEKFNEREYIALHTQDITKAVIKHFAQECRTNGVEFVLASITRGEENDNVMAFCKREGIKAVDISVNLSEVGSRNLPHDDHPSAKSQAVYAEKLGAFLKSAGIKALNQ